jgi:hypothetical protein
MPKRYPPEFKRDVVAVARAKRSPHTPPELLAIRRLQRLVKPSTRWTRHRASARFSSNASIVDGSVLLPFGDDRETETADGCGRHRPSERQRIITVSSGERRGRTRRCRSSRPVSSVVALDSTATSSDLAVSTSEAGAGGFGDQPPSE